MGVSFVPADRHRFALVLVASRSTDNLVLTDYYARTLRPRAGPRRRGHRGAGRRGDRAVRHPHAVRRRVAAGTLSGGNQQKLVMAREFDRDLRLLVLDQPTRGLDVGSVEFIHRQTVAKRDAGTAVLLVSAELDEVARALRSDRGDVSRADRGRSSTVATATREEVGLLMATGGGRRPGDAAPRRTERAVTWPRLRVELLLPAGAIVLAARRRAPCS